MASSTVKLSRFQNQPWGFRLAGGKDFNSQLIIQKVNQGSLAEQAGLVSGDAIIRINELPTDHMRHKEAQDTIQRAGNNFELTIQRGGFSTWKPNVTPLIGGPNSPGQHITKTSLAANKPAAAPIGSSHNTAARPFNGVVNGVDSSGRVTALVHNPYNSPAGLYSMSNIADTLSKQTEVLATGAVGINFMKEEKPINAQSEVLRMVQEADSAPKYSSPVPPVQQIPYGYDQGDDDPAYYGTANPNIQSRSFHVLQKALDNDEEPPSVARPGGMVTRTVDAPKTMPRAPGAASTDANTCAECGRVIVGVFVRIKEKSFHADCFKCTTCGTSLKNVGYYNINEKLYCDIHARQIARQNPPAPNLTPVAVPPNAQSLQRALAAQFQQQNFAPSSGFGSPSIQSIAPSSNVVPVPFNVPKLSPPIGSQGSPGQLLKYPQTAPKFNETQRQTPGQKFIWPPPKQSPEPPLAFNNDPVADPILSGLTTNMPTYRPPPGTQHIQFTSATFKQPLPPPPGSKLSPGIISPRGNAPPPATFQSQPQQTFPPPSAMHPQPISAQQPSASQLPAFNATPPQSQGFQAHPSNLGNIAPPSVAAPTPSGGGRATSGTVAGSRPPPKRGRGVFSQAAGPGGRVPVCASCQNQIRGPFITALSKTWCPDHFYCSNAQCHRPLQDVGFIEEQGQLYCENCYEQYLAPVCSKCNSRIKGDCLNAIGKQWHPDCFACAYCKRAFGQNLFYIEDGLPYCDKDWNELFTTKCVGCGFPIEAGDRWVEALNNNYHSQCFKCASCQKPLEGISFIAKGGRPYCKAHSRQF